MNAVILAAGQGTRLRPLTNSIPKPLVEVHGEPMIERQIRFLKEAGIEDITVIIGYRGEQLRFLQKRYGVKIRSNDTFNEYNNIYSMYIASDLLGDSFVLEGDVFLTCNIFPPFIESSNQDNSWYFTGVKQDFKSEWVVNFDQHSKITSIDITDGSGYILSGISYWSNYGANILRKELKKTVEEGGFEHLFWDDLVRADPEKFSVHAWKLRTMDWFEIDSLEDHKKVESLHSVK